MLFCFIILMFLSILIYGLWKLNDFINQVNNHYTRASHYRNNRISELKIETRNKANGL